MEIGVCVGHKNRTDRLISCLVEPITNCDQKDQIVLSLYDCGSEGDVEREVRAIYDGPMVYTCRDEKFTRSHSINAAVLQCSAPYVFICDADMSLPVDFVDQFKRNVAPGKAWFPVCFSLRKGKPREITVLNGWWRDTGFGMAGFFREDFVKIGGLGLRFTKWGGEDADLFERCEKAGFSVVRENCEGLYHNWHARQQWT